ncbi:unnamed protein product [Paramecium pentaurelia]|uniref:Uncharacterized protein n=1 Tax=Paramecium pentaurelia TaxID=43138 RepID=A0A8S1S745_9CILI|nr:unnamed protein product [Paramecium pentaurelia]
MNIFRSLIQFLKVIDLHKFEYLSKRMMKICLIVINKKKSRMMLFITNISIYQNNCKSIQIPKLYVMKNIISNKSLKKNYDLRWIKKSKTKDSELYNCIL